MKPLNSSEAACRSEGTGHTSAAMIAVSRDVRLSITCTICWGETTTSGLRWLATRLFSCSGSSSRPMSLKTLKGATVQRTLKTVAICTGNSASSSAGFPVTWPFPISCCLCVQVPHFVSLEVLSNEAFVERQRRSAETHSMGWLWRIASAGKHCTTEVCCPGEKETLSFTHHFYIN